MPHKCVRCGNIYEDAQLNGCSCGSQLFFFVKNGDIAETIPVKIKKHKKKSKNITNRLKFKGKIETIRVKKPGIYEINIEALLKQRPIILHDKDEKRYTIDLKSIFKSS